MAKLAILLESNLIIKIPLVDPGAASSFLPSSGVKRKYTLSKINTLQLACGQP